MKINRAAPITIGLLVIAASFTSATIAHYASDWGVSYLVGIVFALFTGAAVAISQDNQS